MQDDTRYDKDSMKQNIAGLFSDMSDKELKEIADVTKKELQEVREQTKVKGENDKLSGEYIAAVIGADRMPIMELVRRANATKQHLTELRRTINKNKDVNKKQEKTNDNDEI